MKSKNGIMDIELILWYEYQWKTIIIVRLCYIYNWEKSKKCDIINNKKAKKLQNGINCCFFRNLAKLY